MTFGEILEAFCEWFPRLELIRPTHGGVKWVGHLFSSAEPDIIELKPGLHGYWPVTSEIETIVTARRPVESHVMSIMTRNGKSVAVTLTAVIRINDVKAALGERNWDVDTTVREMLEYVAGQSIRCRELENICESLARGDDSVILKEMLEGCRRELKKFGVFVERVMLKDFDRSVTYRVLGQLGSLPIGHDESEEQEE